jgi:hypothetical protein
VVVGFPGLGEALVPPRAPVFDDGIRFKAGTCSGDGPWLGDWRRIPGGRKKRDAEDLTDGDGQKGMP